MNEFANWLNSENTLLLHPIKLAALAHYKLVHIHPFIDGNGRTSRLLMNTILMRAGFPPVIIPKQERHRYENHSLFEFLNCGSELIHHFVSISRYYKVLELANDGDIRPFMRFIAKCAEKTLDLFLWSATEQAYSEVPALEFYSN